MKKTQKLLVLALASFIMFSCKEEIQEDVTENTITQDEEVEVIDFKGLKVNHRFSTPVEELDLEMSEEGLKEMYTHTSKNQKLDYQLQRVGKVLKRC